MLTLMLVVMSASPAAAPEAKASNSNANAMKERAAVFTIAKEGMGDASLAAEKAQGQLTQALKEADVPLADVQALFPPSSQPATGAKAMKDGLEAFDNLDTDAAGKKFQEALTFFEATPSATDATQMAELHLFLGTIAMQNGKAGKKKATDEITKAAVIDPTNELNPKYFGPDVKKEWDRIVKELDSKPKHQLSFSSSPAGAEVFFRGKSQGLTPTAKPVAVSPGQQLVGFKAAGYEQAGTLVEVGAVDAEAKATLKPVPGYAAQKSKMNDVIPGNFGGKQVPNAAVGVAEAMQSRFLVVAEVDPRGDGKLEVWDAGKGNRLKDVSLTAGSYAAAAKLVKSYVASPAPMAISSGDSKPAAGEVESDSGEPITKKWWFWTIVGVVVVGGAATGIGIAASNGAHAYNPALGF